eukprot:5830736-Amphidinium_carterae.1
MVDLEGFNSFWCFSRLFISCRSFQLNLQIPRSALVGERIELTNGAAEVIHSGPAYGNAYPSLMTALAGESIFQNDCQYHEMTGDCIQNRS